MYFYLIGIDYKSAPIDERERIYLKHNDISDFWQSHNDEGSAVLVTCNRIEIYGAAEYPDDAFSHISDFFKSFPDFAKYAYTGYGREKVFHHALRLASGLESQVKGELQISGQLKKWVSTDVFPAPLKMLWGEAILLSHDIRLRSGFYDENNNIAVFIFNDIKNRLAHKENYEIVVIGTGKIAELFAEYKPKSARLNFAAHKNFNKAKILAGRSQGKAWRLEGIPDLIVKADVVITATKSPHYVLKKKDFENHRITSKQRLYIYDLSLPRGVDPDARDVRGVSLYNLDDLNYMFNGGHSWLKYIELGQGQAG